MYDPAGDARLADGWVRNYDFSGVSFDQKMTATLVTRRHVVMANHYKRSAGDDVIFHDRTGRRVARKLTAVRHVFGDVAVGVLNADVPASLRIYPLPHPSTQPDQLTGQIAVVTNQHRMVFFHEISFVGIGRLRLNQDTQERHGWNVRIVKGDSGNPSFFLANGELILIETHTHGGFGSGPYYGWPDLQTRLQETIDALTPGYTLRYRRL